MLTYIIHLNAGQLQFTRFQLDSLQSSGKFINLHPNAVDIKSEKLLNLEFLIVVDAVALRFSLSEK